MTIAMLLHRIAVCLGYVLLALVLPSQILPSRAIAQAPLPCVIDQPCMVPTGFYLARPPSGWDGTSPLTTLVFFHGWRETAAQTVVDPTLTGFADKHGVLLIIPHGEGQTWSYPGAPGKHRDEFAFVGSVLDDMVKRFPIAPGRVIASGFSQGGSMVWNLACRMGQRFDVFAPVAGGFWEPSPQACDSGPVALIHLHGIKDGTVPMAGRSLRGGVYKQADIRRDWRVWLNGNGCVTPPGDVVMPGEIAAGEFACQRGNACSSGKPLALCLRDGGHALMPEDLETAWGFALAAMGPK